MVLTPGPGEPHGVLGSSLLVLESLMVCWGPHSWSWRQGVLGSTLLILESRKVCWGPHSWSWRASWCNWGPHSWSWRATGCAGVLTPGPGEPQGVLGSSLLVLESRRVCWGPHSWSWRQGVLGSSLLILESRKVCWGPHSWSWRASWCNWGPHSWSWRAAGCAGVLTPGPGEPQGVLGSSLLVLESLMV